MGYRLPEAAKPAIRILIGVGILTGIGLWALEYERRNEPPNTSTSRARDLTGRALLCAALTVAFAAPSPLGNVTVVLIQRLIGGVLGSVAAAGILAVPPPALGARLAAGCIPLLALAAVWVGQDCGLQYGAQFCVLSYILIAVEGSAGGGGAAGAGWLAVARGGGVLVGSLAAGLLGVCVCPQAASNAATERLADALGSIGDLVKAATAPLVVGEEAAAKQQKNTRRRRWWSAAPAVFFVRSSAPIVSAAGSAALTTADLMGATDPDAQAALEAAVGGGEGVAAAAPAAPGDAAPPPPPSAPPGPPPTTTATTYPHLDTAVAQAAARVASALAALEAALPWTRAEVCALSSGGGRPPWARFWVPGLASQRGLKANAAARARRLPPLGDAVTAVRTAAATLVLASNARGRALTPAASAAVGAFWQAAGKQAGLVVEGEADAAAGTTTADPLAAVAEPAAAAWGALRDAWAMGEALEAEDGGEGPAAGLVRAEAAARTAVRALLVETRAGSGPGPGFLKGLTPREASDARGLIRARLALAGLIVSDFERARAAVAEVVRGLPGGVWGGRRA